MIIHSVSNINNTIYRRGQSFRASALFSGDDEKYKNIDVNSADYIKYIYKLSKKMCPQTYEINVETGALQNIVKSKEPAVFIMNHTKAQSKDIDAAVFFNTLLYREFIYQGMGENCLRSKILTGKGFLKKLKDGGKKLQWMGAVPVGSSINEAGKKENAKMLKELIYDFTQDKINIFLFPEGALAALTFLPDNFKFQPGASYIVKKVLENKPQVKVIPLAFAHNKEISSVHIGEPVYFSNADAGFAVTKGNAESKWFDKTLAKFFAGAGKAIITENGRPVGPDNIIPFISGILMKNLKCCIKEAKQDLKISKPKVYIV